MHAELALSDFVALPAGPAISAAPAENPSTREQLHQLKNQDLEHGSGQANHWYDKTQAHT